MPKARETSRKGQGGRTRAPELEEESTTPSPTAVAAEAQRTGVVPLAAEDGLDEVHRHDDTMAATGADPRGLTPDHVGDLGPGGSMMNPDLNRVDDIGRAAGVQEADSGALQTSGEILDRRDRRRAQQDVPDPDGD